MIHFTINHAADGNGLINFQYTVIVDKCQALSLLTSFNHEPTASVPKWFLTVAAGSGLNEPCLVPSFFNLVDLLRSRSPYLERSDVTNLGTKTIRAVCPHD